VAPVLWHGAETPSNNWWRDAGLPRKTRSHSLILTEEVMCANVRVYTSGVSPQTSHRGTISNAGA
jgi:hypothetical protein